MSKSNRGRKLTLEVERCEQELRNLWEKCQKEQSPSKLESIVFYTEGLVARRHLIQKELNAVRGVIGCTFIVPFYATLIAQKVLGSGKQISNRKARIVVFEYEALMHRLNAIDTQEYERIEELSFRTRMQASLVDQKISSYIKFIEKNESEDQVILNLLKLRKEQEIKHNEAITAMKAFVEILDGNARIEAIALHKHMQYLWYEEAHALHKHMEALVSSFSFKKIEI